MSHEQQIACIALARKRRRNSLLEVLITAHASTQRPDSVTFRYFEHVEAVCCQVEIVMSNPPPVKPHISCAREKVISAVADHESRIFPKTLQGSRIDPASFVNPDHIGAVKLSVL
jgi:hypothetical protein